MNHENEISIDPQRQVSARRYAQLQRRLFLAELGLGILFLLGLLWSSAGLQLRYALSPLPYYSAIALFFTMVSIAYSLITFPLSYYQGLALPRYYGLSKETFREWLATLSKETLLGWILGAIVILAIYILLNFLPDWWWLGASALVTILSILISFIAPWFIMPLFFKTEPLSQGDIRQRLESLAVKANFSIMGIFTIDWSRKGDTANAMFFGMGRSRRIILTDTLLKDYTVEEVESILAHELGHYKLGHISQLLILQSVLTLIVFYMTHLAMKSVAIPGGLPGLHGPTDPAGLPLLILALLIFSLILSPLYMAFSRRIEIQADDFSLKLTDNPNAFSQALLRLHEQNLAEAEPSRLVEVLFYDHPPLTRRLAHIHRMMQNAD